MQCIQLYGNKPPLLVITRCPGHSRISNKERALCENSLTNANTKTLLIQAMPFFKEGLFYANIYCAVCHGTASWEEVQHVNTKTSISCPPINVDDYASEEAFHRKLLTSCNFVPKNVNFRALIRRDCAIKEFFEPNQTDSREASILCKTYSARVKHVGTSRKWSFRNSHCAALNTSFDDLEISCLNRDYFDIPLWNFKWAEYVPSFAMLLDFRSWNSPSFGVCQTSNSSFEHECLSPPVCREGLTMTCYTESEFESLVLSSFANLSNQEDSSYNIKASATKLISEEEFNTILNDVLGYGKINSSFLADEEHILVASFHSFFDLSRLFEVMEAALFGENLKSFNALSLQWVQNSSWLSAEFVEFQSTQCSESSKRVDFLAGYMTVYIPQSIDVHYSTLHDDIKASKSCQVRGRKLKVECQDLRLVTYQNLYGVRKQYPNRFAIHPGADFVCLDKVISPQAFAERMVTFSCQALSIGCLVFTLAVYCAMPSLRTVPGRCIMCLCCALLLAQTLLQFGSFAADVPGLCTALGVIDHWAWLASFAWMVALASDIHCKMTSGTVVHHLEQEKRFVLYLIICWGAPTVFVTACVVVNRAQPEWLQYTHEEYCWIDGMVALGVVFALPVSFMLVVNSVLFVLTLIAIRNGLKIALRVRETSRAQSELLVYIRLASLMGFTWVLGLLQNALPHPVVRYAFIVCNALQGVFMFVAFVCKRKIFGHLGTSLRRKSTTQSTSLPAVTSTAP
jgi:hypothetical protein